MHSVPLHKYITDAVKGANSSAEAADLLQAWAKDNDQLYRDLTGPFLAEACHNAVLNKFRMNRREAWNQNLSSNKRVLEHARLLLDFPLLDGSPLRSAKKGAVLDTASFYEKQAEDMTYKSAWLRAIAEKLGRKTVESVFDNSALRALQKTVRGN